MGLTKAQYQKLATKLAGTTRNVYAFASAEFDHEWSDDDFDALTKATGIFRCEECSEWKDQAEGDRDYPGMCAMCVNEQ